MKKKIIFVMIIATISLTGCSKSLDITDEKASMVSEYMANLLLKYDKNYENKLIYDVPVEEDNSFNYYIQQQGNINTNTNQNNNVNTDNNTSSGSKNDQTSVEDSSDSTKNEVNSNNEGNDTDIATVMKQTGFNITYKGYKLTDTYPSDSSNSSVIMSAGEGKTLLVLKFNIVNITNKSKTIDLSDRNISYKLKADKDTIKSVISILPNEIHYFKAKIDSNKSKSVVAVFEVPKDINVSESYVYITFKDKTAHINVK